MKAYSGFRHLADDMLSCVSFGSAASIQYPSGLIGGNSAGWSFAGWFWIANLGSTRTLLAESTTTGAPNVEVLTTGAVRVRPNSGTNIDSTAGVVRTGAVGGWHHIATAVTPLAGGVGYDYLTCVNGEIVSQGRAATGAFAANAGTTSMSMGSGSKTCRLTFWNRPITQAEMRAGYYAGTVPGASAHWPLDDAEGTRGVDTVAPSAARELIVTIGGGGFWSTDAPKQGVRLSQDFGSVLLDGVEDTRLSTVDNVALQLLIGAAGLSVVSWNRPRFASGGTVGALVTGRSGTSPGAIHFALDSRNGSTRMQGRLTAAEALRDSGVTTISSAPIPARNKWRMTGATLDAAGQYIRQYNNGLQVSRVAAAFNGGPFGIPANPNDYTSLQLGEDFGATSGSRLAFNGWIGATYIYDVTLTRQQMRKLYLTGDAGVQPAFRWLMNERFGTVANCSGSKYSSPATLQSGAAWSAEQPW